MTSAVPFRPLTRRNLIAPDNVAIGTVRGTQWVTDRYVLLRADLLRTPIRPVGAIARVDVGPNIAKFLRLLGRHELRRTPLTDTHTVLDAPDTFGRDRKVRLLTGPDGRALFLNARVAAEWLARPWHTIEQRTISGNPGPVVFTQLRRGRPVIAGAVMPVRVEYGHMGRLEAVESPSK